MTHLSNTIFGRLVKKEVVVGKRPMSPLLSRNRATTEYVFASHVTPYQPGGEIVCNNDQVALLVRI